MKRRLTAVAEFRDLVALTVVGIFWLLTGAWRDVPRHNEDRCWDCQHGVEHDRDAVVL